MPYFSTFYPFYLAGLLDKFCLYVCWQLRSYDIFDDCDVFYFVGLPRAMYALPPPPGQFPHPLYSPEFSQMQW